MRQSRQFTEYLFYIRYKAYYIDSDIFEFYYLPVFCFWSIEEEFLQMTGYCMRCRESKDIQEAQQVTMKNGRPATRGKCGECGATMFRIGKPA